MFLPDRDQKSPWLLSIIQAKCAWLSQVVWGLEVALRITRDEWHPCLMASIVLRQGYFLLPWEGSILSQIPFHKMTLHGLKELELAMPMKSEKLLKCLSLVPSISNLLVSECYKICDNTWHTAMPWFNPPMLFAHCKISMFFPVSFYWLQTLLLFVHCFGKFDLKILDMEANTSITPAALIASIEKYMGVR